MEPERTRHRRARAWGERAQEAADCLTTNGIPADRIRSVIGAGPTTQFGPNLEDNRRVQLVMTYEQQP